MFLMSCFKHGLNLRLSIPPLHRPVLTRAFTSTSRAHAPYLVYAPDYTDPDALARRMAVRPCHFVVANKLIEQGVIKVAGGLVTPDTEHAPPPDRHFVGSVLIYDAESLEEARALVERDLYWTEDVWDKDKLVILPIVMATTLQDRAGVMQPTPKDGMDG